MRSDEAPGKLSFKKVCSWCGIVIRRDTAKDSHGMCLKCYARMLSEHGRPHAQGQTLSRLAGDR